MGHQNKPLGRQQKQQKELPSGCGSRGARCGLMLLGSKSGLDQPQLDLLGKGESCCHDASQQILKMYLSPALTNLYLSTCCFKLNIEEKVSDPNMSSVSICVSICVVEINLSSTQHFNIHQINVSVFVEQDSLRSLLHMCQSCFVGSFQSQTLGLCWLLKDQFVLTSVYHEVWWVLGSWFPES